MQRLQPCALTRSRPYARCPDLELKRTGHLEARLFSLRQHERLDLRFRQTGFNGERNRFLDAHPSAICHCFYQNGIR